MDNYTVDDIIKFKCAMYPDNIAFRKDNKKITYSELESLTNNLSIFLNEIGLNSGNPVAIIMEKSFEFIISIFSILKNGAIFVPMNCYDESKRFNDILDDIDTGFIITKSEFLHRIISYAKSKNNPVKIIVLDNPVEGDEIEYKDIFYLRDFYCGNPKEIIKSHDEESIAYIIYTSGSTGKPKGVSIRHKSLLNFIKETISMFGFNQQTRIITLKPFYFDASLTDIFCPIFAGGTTIIEEKVNILPRILKKKLIQEKVTHLSLSPVILKLLVDNSALKEEDFKFLKTISFGGESVPTEYIFKLKENLKHVRFFNRYGPTETTVIVSAYEITEIHLNDVIPIGKPLKDVQFYVVNKEQKLANLGEVGELYIGGIQNMKGYWNDADLTKSVLVKDIVPNQSLYKTGDLVYMNSDENYVFFGREDGVIKKFGYRISLTEVEFAVKRLSLIKDCICIFDKGNDNPSIIAVVSLNKEVSSQQIKEELKNELPVYMIPDVIVTIDNIPYSSTGKPNRIAVKSLYNSGGFKCTL